MAFICENCGKVGQMGHSKQHRRGVAGKRWKKRVTPTPRMFRVNLQKYHGQTLCAKCIKRIKRDAKVAALQV